MRFLSRFFLPIGVGLLGLTWLAPFAIALLMTLKSQREALTRPFWTFPSTIALFENLRFAWEIGKLQFGFRNSLLYATAGAAAAIIIASAAAFALAILRPRASFLIFMVIFSGTLFPFQMHIIPLFRMYQDFGLYDTRWGLLLFYMTISIPFCTFVLRNYFTTIPREIGEAARLDGLSDFGVYLRIYLPLSLAPITTLFVFEFTWIWNDLLFGITLAKSPEVRPIMAGLASLRGVHSASNPPGILAGALLASAPTILVFLGLQRYFIRGLVLSTRG
uniref:Carbohydrate ABC transporter permease n=1 Tax=Thermomicrobium roseum TaxID=500 RepID=A0A7C5RUM9_THERO